MALYTKSQLGKVVPTEGGQVHGRFCGFGFPPIEFITVAAQSNAGEPYLKMIGDPNGLPYELGAVFPKKKDNTVYYTYSIETPMFPAPLSGAFWPDKDNPGVYNILWNRRGLTPEPSAKGDATNTKEARAIETAALTSNQPLTTKLRKFAPATSP